MAMTYGCKEYGAVRKTMRQNPRPFHQPLMLDVGMLMKKSVAKILSSVAVLFVLAIAISVTNHEGWLTAWFILFIFVGIPIFILTWIDLGNSLRGLENPSLFVRVLIIILGVPQAMFGLVALVIGASVIMWVLYNTLIETLPQYKGGILVFGVAPALLLFGIYWLRLVFVRERQERNNETT